MEAVTPKEAHDAAVDKVADMIFPGEKEAPKEEAQVEEPQEEVAEDEEFDYEPDPKPVEEGAEAEIVEVEFEGQLIEAPKAVAEALMRQSDYTQKTQELSAQRKQFEVTLGEVERRREQFEFAQSIQGDVLKAQQLEDQAEQAHKYLRDNIDDLSSTDIEKIRLAIDDARRDRDSLVQSLTQKQQEFQQAQQQSHQELLNKGTEVLRSKIPGWGEESQKQVREYALQSGFTEAEIAQVVDPRHVETLWKASQYDQLQQGKTAAVQKVQKAPSIKPKSRNPMPKEVGNKLNLRKQLKNPKRSVRDKQSDMEKYISGRFNL